MLSLSLFHHQAFLRSYVFGTHGIEGARAVKAYKEGRQAILNFEGMTRELVRAGLTVGRVQDFEEQMVKAAVEKTIADQLPGGEIPALQGPERHVGWHELREKHDRAKNDQTGPCKA